MNYRVFGFAATLAASLPVVAFAQAIDLTPYSGRILSDPEYLPLAGQVFGTTSYSHGWFDGDSIRGSGTEFSTFHVDTNTINQTLAYGITDEFSVNASIAYTPGDSREIDYTGGQRSIIDSSGFADPTFGATWRILDQATWPANFDLFGSYSPDWIGAHTGTAIQNGTVARGGDSGIIGAAVGVVTKGFSIRGAFDVNFLGQSNVLDLANGDLLQTESHTNFDISLETQTRLTDLFSFNAGISHTFASNANGVDLANGLPHYDEPGDVTTLDLALNYNFIPNAFVVSATYAHDFYGTGRTFYADPLNDVETTNRSGNIVGVKLTYATP